MEQGSSAWTGWRDEGIGSSDIPVIVEAEGAYQTRNKLYLSKLKLLPPPTEKELKSKKFIFDKGHQIEAMVRGRYELKDNISYSAALFQREDHAWCKASVDLCNHDLKRIKEVKYVSLEEFEAGVCPARYFPQIQWQYLNTGEDWTVDLVLATDYMWDESRTEKIKLSKQESFRTKEVAVPIDKEYCLKIFDEGHKFWHDHILKKIPPALSERDAVSIKGKDLKAKLRKYAANKKKIDKVKVFEDENEALKEEIFKLTTHPIMTCGKIKVVTSEKKGTIDYKKIPAVKEMKEEELEKYRGKSSVTRSIKC
jgi:predicted phage-related endonuclease